MNYKFTSRSEEDTLELAENIVKKHNLQNPVYVGDTIKDKQSSDEANVEFIFASYGFGNVECDKKIASLEELLNI